MEVITKFIITIIRINTTVTTFTFKLIIKTIIKIIIVIIINKSH
jgi:hypothetical protein